MDKNLIPSARRITRAEGHQQRTPKRSSSFEQVDFEQVAEKRQACDAAKNDTNLAKQSGVSKNTQHNVKLLPWKSNRNLVKKSLEIQVEEEHVAETKNKVQTVKNSLEMMNSSIKQTQTTSVNGYRGDECQNRAYAEKTKSSESKRTQKLVRNLKVTGGPGEEQNTESRMRRTRRRSKPRSSEKHPHEGKGQGQVSMKTSLC